MLSQSPDMFHVRIPGDMVVFAMTGLGITNE
jgi:hypothetical protein